MKRADRPDTRDTPAKSTANAVERPGARSSPSRRRSISMHEGIAVWCDCCSCEAEPYWVEIAEEMGLDLGSDYEDTEADDGDGA
ncbi:MAG: hypothetical protein MUC77_10905 [Chromatiaceae bacterium]|nr:hypothetical protein [Chromatiaceae bacterium]